VLVLHLTRDAPIIGIGQLFAILPIIGMGQLVRWYRPIIVDTIGKYRFLLHDVSMVEIIVFERGWVTPSANFGSEGMRHRPPTSVVVRKLESVVYHVALFA